MNRTTTGMAGMGGRAALRLALMLGAPAGLAFGATAAHAEEPAPSTNAMVNLVRLLVAQGTIAKDKGDELIAEATREAEKARAEERAAIVAAATAAANAAPVRNAAAQPTPQYGQAAPALADGGLPPPPPGTIRVPYVPEVVREQIRDELREDVIKQAKAEGWASPQKAAPEWTQRFHPYADLRIRSQSNFFSKYNATDIPNFQGIVAGGALDLINSQIPLLNTTRDKYNIMKVRARFGTIYDVNDRIKVGIEIASGNDQNPLTTNANLGNGFFKRNLYLNKAYVQGRITDAWTLTGGRFDNPFLATDAMFDPDLEFDGVAGEVRLPRPLFGIGDVALRGGAFPLDLGGQNFPETATTKSTGAQKWLFSAQLEGDWHLPHGVLVRAAGAYHWFANVQGRPSAACALYAGVTQCSTDWSTPFFVQKGNSLSFIRRIALNPSATGTQAQPQLLGLTQPFRVLDAVVQVHVPISQHTEFALTGDYLLNTAFRKGDACRYGLAGEPVNNGGSGGSGNICDATIGSRTPYVAGNEGFQVIAALGYPKPYRWGEWKVFGGYKYLESDATLDAFVDDDFHLGGTNAKGFTLGAEFGLWPGVTWRARWLSANQVTGEPFAADVAQFDLNVAF